MAEFNKEGHALGKPKMRPGGADMSEDCKKEDRLLTKRQQRLESDLKNVRNQFEPKLITAADIDAEDPFKATFEEAPKFFKQGTNVLIANPERPDSELLACLKEEEKRWQLCGQKELTEEGNDFSCDEKRSEDFHWREGDTVKFLGTCIEPKPLKKAIRCLAFRVPPPSPPTGISVFLLTCLCTNQQILAPSKKDRPVWGEPFGLVERP
ncbi:unnamed protein product [Effrenium voratum]|uniref:Uncharacterized protein n=1 Tax=Effrenium voratum TaxID=2562239 RepID=A0AA36IWW0_9DINO|nr:unnamed protein product [Effrenium voratum]